MAGLAVGVKMSAAEVSTVGGGAFPSYGFIVLGYIVGCRPGKKLL